MSTSTADVEQLIRKEYEHGFVTEIDTETVPPGLDEDVIRTISARKNEPEWLLQWRLQAFAHWQTLSEPEWAVPMPPTPTAATLSFSLGGLCPRPST